MKAQIFRSSQRNFDCKIIDTGEMVVACALGNLLKGRESLVVGDFVRLEIDEQEEYKIIEVEDRKT